MCDTVIYTVQCGIVVEYSVEQKYETLKNRTVSQEGCHCPSQYCIYECLFHVQTRVLEYFYCTEK